MGLERLAMVMQGVGSIYDIDLYQAIIQRAADAGGVRYGADAETDRALRVIADHARGATFLIARRRVAGQRRARLRLAPHPAPRDSRTAASSVWSGRSWPRWRAS